MAHRPIITLTTDFGSTDHFVGAMKGVILDIVPEAQIVDICHSVQAFDVLDGALTISQAYSYFPNRTIHVVIVDPGVGTARRPILASSDKYHFVAPDNGVLSLVYARERACMFGTSPPNIISAAGQQHVPWPRHFSPVAAYLAKEVNSLKFGDEVEDYVRFSAPKPKAVEENRVRGVVLKVDRFGNLITNITPQDAPVLFGAEGKTFKIVVGNARSLKSTVPTPRARRERSIGVLGSMGFLEIAANRGAAAQLTGAGKGTDVTIMLGDAPAAGKEARRTGEISWTFRCLLVNVGWMIRSNRGSGEGGRWLKVLGMLNEFQARLFVADKALDQGRGGISRMSALTGMSRTTITKAVAELTRPGKLRFAVAGRIREWGAGRKKVEQADEQVRRELKTNRGAEHSGRSHECPALDESIDAVDGRRVDAAGTPGERQDGGAVLAGNRL